MLNTILIHILTGRKQMREIFSFHYLKERDFKKPEKLKNQIIELLKELSSNLISLFLI